MDILWITDQYVNDCKTCIYKEGNEMQEMSNVSGREDEYTLIQQEVGTCWRQYMTLLGSQVTLYSSSSAPHMAGTARHVPTKMAMKYKKCAMFQVDLTYIPSFRNRLQPVGDSTWH